MTLLMERISDSGVIAVVRLDDLSAAVDLSRALLEGGVDIIEFTLTNPDAPAAIERVIGEVGDNVVVGAGSVTTVSQVEAVANAGAAFVVSPVTNIPVIEACHEHDLPVVPGAFTPTEIQQASEMGAAAVKVFPARALGPSYIKDVLAPLPDLKLIPTGGIGPGNIGDYIRAGVIAAGVGGSLVDRDAISAGDWGKITDSARALKRAVQAARA